MTTATTTLRRHCAATNPCPHCKAGCPTAPTGVTVDNVWETVDASERRALPPEFHRPTFDGLGEPNLWLCAVCWDEGEVTQWPCHVATAHGVEVAEAIGVGWSW